jgi:cell wall-associated NlpC family hydrolase
MTPAGAAGMMGNLRAESGLIANRVEILCLRRLKEHGKIYTDATYTAFIDDGTISKEEFLHPLPGKQYGYGLAQWTSPGRKSGLYDLCKSRKVSIGDMQTQLDWLITELKNSYQSVWKALTSSDSVYNAAEIVLKKFECPADTGASVIKARADYGYEYYNKYAAGSGSAKPAPAAAKQKESKNMTVAEKALQWAIAIAKDQSHGYSQASRWGQPDYDCSSFAISAYRTGAGVPININVVNYTGNMTGLLQYGFKDVTKSVNLNNGSGLQPGDILWYHLSGTNGHAAIYAGNGQIVHARGQSKGGPAPGDQGDEIGVTAYSRGSWQHVYRYAGSATVSSGSSAAPAAPIVKRYAVSTQLPIIKNGSVGTCVKIWQQIIGVTADGEFGPNTLAKTKTFQSQHKCDADGEVGPQTWAAGLGSIT